MQREGQGEDGVHDVAKLFGGLFGKVRRLTGTLWDEILFNNHFSSPPWELSIREFNVCAAELPGVELPGIVAGDGMVELFLHHIGEGGRVGGQGFGRFGGDDLKKGVGGRGRGESAVGLVDACEGVSSCSSSRVPTSACGGRGVHIRY